MDLFGPPTSLLRGTSWKLIPVPYHSEGLVYAAQTESSVLSRDHAEALLALSIQREIL